MNFKIVGKIEQERTFAAGSKIRELARLQKFMVKGDGGSERVLPRFSSRMEPFELQRYTGTRQRVSVEGNTKLNTLWIKL